MSGKSIDLVTTWTQNYAFDASDGANTVPMDVKPPHGSGKAMTPKQLCLAAIEGCTAMDVISHLKKHKQDVKSFRVEATAPLTEGHPSTFSEVRLDFHLTGEMETAKALEAVQLSQTKYCGVSAMMAAHCPVHYRVHLNGSVIGQGEAKFPR